MSSSSDSSDALPSLPERYRIDSLLEEMETRPELSCLLPSEFAAMHIHRLTPQYFHEFPYFYPIAILKPSYLCASLFGIVKANMLVVADCSEFGRISYAFVHFHGPTPPFVKGLEIDVPEDITTLPADSLSGEILAFDFIRPTDDEREIIDRSVGEGDETIMWPGTPDSDGVSERIAFADRSSTIFVLRLADRYVETEFQGHGSEDILDIRSTEPYVMISLSRSWLRTWDVNPLHPGPLHLIELSQERTYNHVLSFGMGSDLVYVREDGKLYRSELPQIKREEGSDAETSVHRHGGGGGVSLGVRETLIAPLCTDLVVPAELAEMCAEAAEGRKQRRGRLLGTLIEVPEETVDDEDEFRRGDSEEGEGNGEGEGEDRMDVEDEEEGEVAMKAEPENDDPVDVLIKLEGGGGGGGADVEEDGLVAAADAPATRTDADGDVEMGTEKTDEPAPDAPATRTDADGDVEMGKTDEGSAPTPEAEEPLDDDEYEDEELTTLIYLYSELPTIANFSADPVVFLRPIYWRDEDNLEPTLLLLVGYDHSFIVYSYERMESGDAEAEKLFQVTFPDALARRWLGHDVWGPPIPGMAGPHIIVGAGLDYNNEIVMYDFIIRRPETAARVDVPEWQNVNVMDYEQEMTDSRFGCPLRQTPEFDPLDEPKNFTRTLLHTRTAMDLVQPRRYPPCPENLRPPIITNFSSFFDIKYHVIHKKPIRHFPEKAIGAWFSPLDMQNFITTFPNGQMYLYTSEMEYAMRMRRLGQRLAKAYEQRLRKYRFDRERLKRKAARLMSQSPDPRPTALQFVDQNLSKVEQYDLADPLAEVIQRRQELREEQGCRTRNREAEPDITLMEVASKLADEMSKRLNRRRVAEFLDSRGINPPGGESEMVDD